MLRTPLLTSSPTKPILREPKLFVTTFASHVTIVVTHGNSPEFHLNPIFGRIFGALNVSALLLPTDGIALARFHGDHATFTPIGLLMPLFCTRNDSSIVDWTAAPNTMPLNRLHPLF